MMWLKVIGWLMILEVCSLIGPSFSSTFLKFGDKITVEEYTRLKNTNVHRGVIFSLSSEQKYEICEDIFSAQLYVNPKAGIASSEERMAKMVISDSIESVKQGIKPEFPVFCRRTVKNALAEPEWSLSFRCLGRNFQKRSPTKRTSTWYHIYSAFHPKWLYSARRIVSSEDSFILDSFISLSPDHVQIEQPKLEIHYVNTQLKLMDLRNESSQYMNLIKERVDLFNLTKLQKFILCASILSSPVYREKRFEFSFDWMDTTENTLDLVTKPVALTSTLHPKEKLKATCIPCTAFEDGSDLNSRAEILYLSPTYDDAYSIMVLKENNEGRLTVDKYFKNVAILITLFQQMDYAELLANFPRQKRKIESEQN